MENYDFIKNISDKCHRVLIVKDKSIFNKLSKDLFYTGAKILFHTGNPNLDFLKEKRITFFIIKPDKSDLMFDKNVLNFLKEKKVTIAVTNPSNILSRVFVNNLNLLWNIKEYANTIIIRSHDKIE